MKHTVANRLLNLYVGDDLPAGVSGKVKAHVDQCEACTSELALLRGDQEALHAFSQGIEAEPLPVEMGERFWLNIRRELRTSGMVGERAAEHAARPAAAWWGTPALWRGLAAAAVLVAAVLVTYGPFSGSNPANNGEGERPGEMIVERIPASAVIMETHASDDLGLERVRSPEAHRGSLEPIEPFAPLREQRLEWQPGAREVHGF